MGHFFKGLQLNPKITGMAWGRFWSTFPVPFGVSKLIISLFWPVIGPEYDIISSKKGYVQCLKANCRLLDENKTDQGKIG
jgi:hypothetical protein